MGQLKAPIGTLEAQGDDTYANVGQYDAHVIEADLRAD